MIEVVRINARLNVGGIARHVAWLTDGLRDRGYATVLIAGTVPDGEADMRDFVRAQGVEPVILSEMSREISLRDVAAVWKVYRLLRAVRPRIVHTHAAKAGAVGRVAAFLYRWCTFKTLIGRPRECKVIHTYHGHIFHGYYGRLKTRFFLFIERALARATDRIIAISPSQRDEIHGTYRVGRAEQFAVVPLGIDLEAYSRWPDRTRTLRTELGFGAGDILVGIVGRLTEIKNHRLFLKAAALDHQYSPANPQRKVRYLIIGDGHLRAGLEAEARELGLADCVAFLGMRPDPEIFYPALDVVALTSNNEGTPLSIIEGFANGRAVVLTAVGGVVDLVGPSVDAGANAEAGYRVCERGLLVPPGDTGAMARAIRRAIDDEPLRCSLGKRGLAFVHRCYSKERLMQDMAALYDELLNQPVLKHSPTALSTRSQPCGS